MKQNILFDLDDTLIHCNRFFASTREVFADRILDWFHGYTITRDVVLKTQEQLDLAGVESLGFGKDRFPESLMQTYILMCDKIGRPQKEDEKQMIREIGYSVYGHSIELYPYALETLGTLREQGHELYLYTGGDRDIQTQKVINSGLDELFPEKRRFIFEHKNVEALGEILGAQKLSKAHTWMIGNSARSDIRPALEAGIHAIHVPDAGGWSYDHIQLDIPAKGEFHVVQSLAPVAKIIIDYAILEAGA